MSRIAWTILPLLCVATAPAQSGLNTRIQIPNLSQQQAAALVGVNRDLQPLVQAVVTARTAVVTASYTLPADEDVIKTKADAVQAAELALARARADAFQKLQRSPGRLSPEQATAFAGMSLIVYNGRGRIPNLTEQ